MHHQTLVDSFSRPICPVIRPSIRLTESMGDEVTLPEASTDSLSPPPLRLLSARATRRRVGIAPTQNRRLCTPHSFITFREPLPNYKILAFIDIKGKRLLWSAENLDLSGAAKATELMAKLAAGTRHLAVLGQRGLLQ